MTAPTHAPLSYAHGVSGTEPLGDTIGAGLDRAVSRWPDREVLVDVLSGRRWTYTRHRTSDYRAMVGQVRGHCPVLRETVYVGDPGWDAPLGRATPEWHG